MKSKLVLRQLFLPSVFLLAASTAYAASAVWNVDAAGDWATGGNWNPAAAPGATSGTTNPDTATFGSVITADRIVTVDTGRNISVIDFNANNTVYTLSGGSLVLSSGGTIKTSGAGTTHNADTISSPITLANANAATSGTLSILGESTNALRGLVISGGITGAATAESSTLTLGGTTTSNTGAQQNKITGDIANGSGGGTLAVEKTGTGLWILEGAKTFNGGLTVREGELRLASNAAAAGSGLITLGDTTGTANAILTVASSITPTNALTVATGSSGTKTLRCGNVANPRYNGAITLNDPLTIEGTSSTNTNFELAGASGISLNANTLTLRLATASASISNTITVAKAVSGTGAIAIVGAGTASATTRVVALNGTNSYTGGTTVGIASGGSDRSLTVDVSGDQSAANGGWTMNAATPNSITYTVNFLSGSTIGVAAGKNIELVNGNCAKALNVAGTVTTGASGNLNVRGNGTLTLDSGANWTQNGGFINIQPSNSSFSAVMTVNSGASFTYAGTNNINLARATSTGNGSATLNLSGGTFTTSRGISNTAAGTGSGTTNLNFSGGGTLKLSANIASLIIEPDPLKPFIVTTGTGDGIIDTNGFSTVLDVGVSGAGGLTKAGAGTLTLNVANTYTGATTVTGGTLALSGVGDIDDSASVTIAAGAKLDTTAKTGTYAPANIQPISFGLNAASTGTSGQIDADSLNITNANISFDVVNGPLDDAQYVLATYSGTLTGTFAASAPAGYTYDYGTGANSQIKLVAASGSPYDTWAGGPGLPFDGDANGDGVSNGLAFLLGAFDKNENAINRLPTVTQNGGDLVLDFDCLPVSARGVGVTLKVEHSTDLANWAVTTNAVPDADNLVPDSNVTFQVGAGPAGPPALNSVTATIGSAAAGGGGKLFARLKAMKP